MGLRVSTKNFLAETRTQEDRVHSVSPDADVIFFPYKTEDTSGWLAPKPSKSQKMDVKDGISVAKEIISLRTSKGKGAVGSWQVVLGSGTNWKKILHPGAWALIYMSNEQLSDTKESELDSGLKMVGVVKSVRRSENIDPSTGIMIVRYIVTGEDFQTILNTPIFMSVNLSASVQNAPSPIANNNILLGEAFTKLQSPSEMAISLITALMGTPGKTIDGKTKTENTIPFQSRAGEPFLVPAPVIKRVLGKNNVTRSDMYYTSFLTFFLQKNLIGETNIQSDLGRTVTVWGLLKTYCHELLNEIYCDLLPVNNRLTPSFVIRAIPFSSRDGKQKIKQSSLISMLDATEKQTLDKNGKVKLSQASGSNFYVSKVIYEDEILSFNSGESDGERFNFFYIPPNVGVGDPAVNDASFLSKILETLGGDFSQVGDPISIARYGLRPYIAFSNYITTASDFIGPLNRIVKDMWQRAYLYENGQITIIGSKEHIPVGTNSELTERGWIFHNERVDNDFSVSADGIKRFNTTLTFVRLQRKSDGKPVDSSDEPDDANGQIGTWDRGVGGK